MLFSGITAYTVFSSLVKSGVNQLGFGVSFCYLPAFFLPCVAFSVFSLCFDPPPTLHSSVRATGRVAGTANQFCSPLQQPVGVRGQRPSDGAHCCPLVLSIVYRKGGNFPRACECVEAVKIGALPRLDLEREISEPSLIKSPNFS